MLQYSVNAIVRYTFSLVDLCCCTKKHNDALGRLDVFLISLSFPQIPGQINPDNLKFSITTVVWNETVTLYLSSENQPFAFDYPGRSTFCAGFLVMYIYIYNILKDVDLLFL